MAAGDSNPNQVVHMRADSDSELQALFDSVLQPNSANGRAKGVPLRLRKLPDSFFNPPSSRIYPNSNGGGIILHSRERSVDSGALLRSSRASPLPATAAALGNSSALNGTGMTNAGQGQQPLHSRTQSSPACLDQSLTAFTPSALSNAAVAAAVGQQHSTPTGSANNLTDDPLPPGWEQAATQEGQIYFINHITRSTTWEDPRKAQHAQILQAVATTSAVNVAPSGRLPDGWEQAMTAEGQVYFINHVTRTTSWFDPRLPAHLQRPPVLQQQLNAAAANVANAAAVAAAVPAASALAQQQHISSMAASTASQQHEVRLHQLQQEKERLQMRQQEIKRQMEAEQQRLQKRKPDDDPFLGGSIATDHTRQESADSGLGISSHPQTPEDFLDNMGYYFNNNNSSPNQNTAASDDASVLTASSLSSADFNDYQQSQAYDNTTYYSDDANNNYNSLHLYNSMAYSNGRAPLEPASENVLTFIRRVPNFNTNCLTNSKY